MSKLRNLEDLFEHELRDLYSAESQLLKALPKMAKEAADAQLKKIFEEHFAQTEQHKERLEKVFEILKISAGSVKCEAMEGLIEEGKEMIDEKATSETKDAGLIGKAQKIEHYEISSYGTAAHYAERLGHAEVHSLLKETLNEEKQADSLLNSIAKTKINQKAIA